VAHTAAVPACPAALLVAVTGVEVVVDAYVVVVVDVVVVVTVVEVVVVGAAVVVVEPVRLATSVPRRAAALGPGRLNSPSIMGVPVALVQEYEASVTLAGMPDVMGPAGEPTSSIVRPLEIPKHPGGDWPIQNTPSAVGAVEPMVFSVRVMPIVPTREPSMHAPPPGVQGCVASVPPVGQSRVRPSAFVVVQD
jgi:hypothetical protein